MSSHTALELNGVVGKILRIVQELSPADQVIVLRNVNDLVKREDLNGEATKQPAAEAPEDEAFYAGQLGSRPIG